MKRAAVLIGLIVVSSALLAFLVTDSNDKPVISKIALPNLPYPEPTDDQRLPWEIPLPKETYRFPIELGAVGPITPLFAKNVAQPFYCRTLDSGLGPPQVDNQEGFGFPVYEYDSDGSPKKLVGYSENCSLPTHIRYFYNRVGTDKFYPYDENVDDVATFEFNGKSIPFIVKVEIGTINRFIYSIIMLHGDQPLAQNRGQEYWNRKLLYYFHGGVGIGKHQGKLKLSKTLHHLKDQLAQGYAALYSTGNQTSVHYHIPLAEDTALRVKKQFTSQYGPPLFTIGVGGSGGAIQQYLFAQNDRGLLDGIIPLYSYPDMMTQIRFSFDCELLEYYFDVTDGDNPRWQTWENKTLIQGMNADSKIENRFGKYNRFASLFKFQWARSSEGASECTNGWRGLTPYVNNPTLSRKPKHFTPELRNDLHFTLWDDLRRIVGRDESGYARVPWGNQGVQYGLQAWLGGQIETDEFLKLNRKIGTWKPPQELIPEKFWYFTGDYNPRNFDMHSAHNMQQSLEADGVAPRSSGDLKAIRRIYHGGLVFFGRVDVPVFDVRHYLEAKLDMHHLSASFNSRARILAYQGHSDNMVLWVTKRPHTPVSEVISLMDEWLSNMSKGLDMAAAKPKKVVDSCFNEEGKRLAAGPTVWDGPWNQSEKNGECLEHYPSFSNSRMVAGESWLNLSFQCQRHSVQAAVSEGAYGDLVDPKTVKALEAIFPDGVCDFSLPPAGFPEAVAARYQQSSFVYWRDGERGRENVNSLSGSDTQAVRD